MYRQTRIFAPLVSPFDNSQWAETLIGQIIAPVVLEGLRPDWFWFSRYDCSSEEDSGDCDINHIPNEFMRPQNRHFRSVRFRYFIPEDSRQAFEDRCLPYIQNAGCAISNFCDYDFFGDLGGPRHLGGERTEPRQQCRARLVGKVYQAVW